MCNHCGVRFKKLQESAGAFVDFIHQPFRAKLMPFLPGVIAAAEKAGALGAFLSGSGSTICAITLQHPDRIAAAMKRAARPSLSVQSSRAPIIAARMLSDHQITITESPFHHGPAA